ncbi:MAG: hypothetical protein IJ593_05865 [Lachnospiraceae bacterium]|nr:hypothetical protein [Lachnospiraceae bacterium]
MTDSVFLNAVLYMVGIFMLFGLSFIIIYPIEKFLFSKINNVTLYCVTLFTVSAAFGIGISYIIFTVTAYII